MTVQKSLYIFLFHASQNNLYSSILGKTPLIYLSPTLIHNLHSYTLTLPSSKRKGPILSPSMKNISIYPYHIYVLDETSIHSQTTYHLKLCVSVTISLKTVVERNTDIVTISINYVITYLSFKKLNRYCL